MTPDELCARKAQSQFGLFTRAQALEAGSTPRLLRYRVATGKLDELLPGIYKPAGAPTGWHQRLLAAQMWASPLSAAYGRSAALLWKIEADPPKVVEVVTTRGLVAPKPWLRVHRARLDAADVRTRDGVPVTTVERTLIDVAASARGRLEAAVDAALSQRLTTVERLQNYMHQLPPKGRPGTRGLRQVLAELSDAAPSASWLERKLLRALRDHGVPLPVRQHPVLCDSNTYYLDFAYPDAQLGIEAHSFKHHSARADWERDQVRHNALERIGWSIIYVTWRQLRDHPDRVAATILATLKDRSLLLFRE